MIHPQVEGLTRTSEEDEIQRLLLELEGVSTAIERTAAEAAREAAEEGREIDRLLTQIRVELAKQDEWVRVSSTT